MSTYTEKDLSSQFLQTHFAFLFFRITSFISVPLSSIFCAINLWEHNMGKLVFNGLYLILSIIASLMFWKSTFPNHWQLKANCFLFVSSIVHVVASFLLHTNNDLFILRNLIICWLVGGNLYLVNFITQTLFFVFVGFLNAKGEIQLNPHVMGEPINRVIWMGSFGALMVIYRSKIEHYFFSTQKAMDNINQQLEAANKKLKTKQKQLTDAENQSTILTHRMKQSKKNIENLLTHLKSDNSSKVKLLKQNLQENIKDPDAEYPVLNAVTRANESFIQNLNKLHPNLTAYEVNLLSLLLLKLNTNQICNQLLITEGSLRKAKTRLRKKLGLEERANLYDFAQSIA